ncbi:hypothetical protein H5398_10290 [Tessaracoccus sp. MC1679]|uniref:hypothetical protein n=1 Tax=Tessaracoccus sp. MC1679 TaxID=2760313 RepID=UPI0016009B2A|nr:hypothetical protein [Tessaracoccus sp. MC1679]MBB1516355.1 hypothetical protein [Tessaracoccus sp. MC1679]
MRERTHDDSFDDLFDDDLHAALDATAAEHRASLTRHLVADLSRVQNRGTPLRGAEGYGSDGVVRLRFADGTTVLARGDGKGGLGFAAVAVIRGSAVLLAGVHDDGLTVHAVLAWDRRHHVRIEIIGSDQPD